MKRIQLLTLLAALCLAACTERDRVIDRPAFKSMSDLDIQPVRVELTGEATVVHFHIRCADWRNWSMTGARLEADGQTFACLQGRILTREGDKTVADEVFEFGKEYEKDARRDSVILTFDPLPRRTKTFDFIEDNTDNPWTSAASALTTSSTPSNCPPIGHARTTESPWNP